MIRAFLGIALLEMESKQQPIVILSEAKDLMPMTTGVLVRMP